MSSSWRKRRPIRDGAGSVAQGDAGASGSQGACPGSPRRRAMTWWDQTVRAAELRHGKNDADLRAPLTGMRAGAPDGRVASPLRPLGMWKRQRTARSPATGCRARPSARSPEGRHRPSPRSSTGPMERAERRKRGTAATRDCAPARQVARPGRTSHRPGAHRRDHALNMGPYIWVHCDSCSPTRSQRDASPCTGRRGTDDHRAIAGEHAARVNDRRVITGILRWDEPERHGPRTTNHNRAVRWRDAALGTIVMIDDSCVGVHLQGTRHQRRPNRSSPRSIQALAASRHMP